MSDSGPHVYRTHASWTGSTGVGYDRYDRTHTVTAELVGGQLTVSADAAFRGDGSQLNPEQLLLAAASSCQLLSFLAVAARARIDVVAYEDDAEATLGLSARPIRITEIRIHPRIRVRGPAATKRIEELAQVAHNECFIANSLACPVTVEPVVEVA